MTALPRFDVLGFGAVAVDELLFVDAYPAAEQKVRVNVRLRQCGGLTGTALVAASRLGARCAYVGRLGDDELSQEVAACLAREGIELAHCVRRPDARPAQSIIIVDQQRKTRTIFASLAGAIGPDAALPAADLIRLARVLLVDHHGLEGTLRAVRIGREAGVAVVADLERDPGPPFEAILGLVDHLVLSERFARQLTGRHNPARAAAALWRPDRRAVVVTCGAAGCWYVGPEYGGQARHCPAFPVEVVDTTGCGDVFHGAYAAGLARGMDLAQCVDCASAAAALKATRPGGQAGIPDREALAAFLAERG